MPRSSRSRSGDGTTYYWLADRPQRRFLHDGNTHFFEIRLSSDHPAGAKDGSPAVAPMGTQRVTGLREPMYPGSPTRFPLGEIDLPGFPAPEWDAVPPAAVLFDRDGTLIRDVPYNGDPDRVEPMPYARAVLDLLRGRGIRLGVVTNQSGLGRGLLTVAAVARVHARIEQLLGPFDVWQVCPHAPADGCACRKPAPGLILTAADALGLPPERCAVIGDIGSDIAAARAAGAPAVLVPTPVTLAEEVRTAPVTAPHLLAAVRLLGVRA